MIAAAQNHMQKNLTAKMASIGVPMSAFGMATGDGGQKTDPDAIPLPEDPMGVDMAIANVEIPLPIGGADDDRPPGDDDDCAPPGENLCSETSQIRLTYCVFQDATEQFPL